MPSAAAVFRLMTSVKRVGCSTGRSAGFDRHDARYRILPGVHSTAGAFGAGVEAQRTAVLRFAEAEGINLIAEHTQIETGKGADALQRIDDEDCARRCAGGDLRWGARQQWASRAKS
jgi:hypothetical protein